MLTTIEFTLRFLLVRGVTLRIVRYCYEQINHRVDGLEGFSAIGVKIIIILKLHGVRGNWHEL